MKNFYADTIEITDRHDSKKGVFHIPTPNIDMGGFQTLCGFCDVNLVIHNYTKHQANCAQCIDVLKAVKAMKFPSDYFSK